MNLKRILVLGGATVGLGLGLKFGGFGSGPNAFSVLFSTVMGFSIFNKGQNKLITSIF